MYTHAHKHTHTYTHTHITIYAAPHEPFSELTLRGMLLRPIPWPTNNLIIFFKIRSASERIKSDLFSTKPSSDNLILRSSVTATRHASAIVSVERCDACADREAVTCVNRYKLWYKTSSARECKVNYTDAAIYKLASTVGDLWGTGGRPPKKIWGEGGPCIPAPIFRDRELLLLNVRRSTNRGKKVFRMNFGW